MMVWLRFVCACASGQPSSGTGWYDARFFVGPTLGVLQVMPRGGEGEGGGGGGGGGKGGGGAAANLLWLQQTCTTHHWKNCTSDLV